MSANDVAIYEIKEKGVLDDGWSEWFDGMTLSSDDASGETMRSGPVADRVALHGLLEKVRDLTAVFMTVERRAGSRSVRSSPRRPRP